MGCEDKDNKRRGKTNTIGKKSKHAGKKGDGRELKREGECEEGDKRREEN